MSFPAVYSQRFPSAKLAVAVDLSAGDWSSRAGSVLSTNPLPTTSLYVGSAGDLQVVMAGDPSTSVLFKNHPVGYADLGIARVLKAGTTAADIVAIY